MSIYQSPSAPFPAKWVHLADHPKKAPTLRYHQVSRSWDSRLRLWNILTVWYHLMKKVKSLTFRIHLYKVTGLLVRQFQKPPQKRCQKFIPWEWNRTVLSFFLFIDHLPKIFSLFQVVLPQTFLSLLSDEAPAQLPWSCSPNHDLLFLSAPPSYAESIRGQTRRYDAVYYNKGEEFNSLNSPQFSADTKKTS